MLNMKVGLFTVLVGVFAPLAVFAAREGTPVYYQQAGSNVYAGAGSNVYVGEQRQSQVIGQRTYTYQVPRSQLPSDLGGAATPAGVATDKKSPWVLSAAYAQKYADFQFKTGVNSILEWDHMIFNELGVRLDSNFSVKNYDLFAYGEYRMGNMSSGGFSID